MAEQKILDGFVVWCRRSVARMSWTERRTNEILEKYSKPLTQEDGNTVGKRNRGFPISDAGPSSCTELWSGWLAGNRQERRAYCIFGEKK